MNDEQHPDYDPGLLSDFGGGDVNWWHDYLRAEIARTNEYWQEKNCDPLITTMTSDQLLAHLEDFDARLSAIESRAESTVASAASLLGRIKSDKKAAAARANGAKRWENHTKKTK